MKWTVCMIFDATMTVEVEADTAEEAKEKAMDEASSPSLCHQCARELAVGDVVSVADAWET